MALRVTKRAFFPRIQPDNPQEVRFYFALCKKWPTGRAHPKFICLQMIQASQMFTFGRMFRICNGTLLNGQLAVHKKYIFALGRPKKTHFLNLISDTP